MWVFRCLIAVAATLIPLRLPAQENSTLEFADVKVGNVWHVIDRHGNTFAAI
ncbi:MAG: hypothetical protein ABIQ57_17725 [Candidatus Kapaibacterium sp.]